MTQQHPTTPPPELVQQWVNQFAGEQTCMPEQVYIARAAAQWGADQELDSSNSWLVLNGYGEAASRLRAARRPKPPSLKEQALEALASAPGPDYPTVITVLNVDQHALIRRALEQLDDNE